jgi:glutaredoxin-related protein
MITVYGSPLCPDCRECKANFDIHGIAYEEVDITASMKNLKAFLKLRDTLAVFDPCRAQGSVGIPAIVSGDGSVTLDWEGYLSERGLPVVYREERPACRLDGSGC